ncbi:uncharacterized protein LOC108697305 isoform X2 [Xenopus laevis]|uniref:Uncharacterized protein LOC108697305 isoform X2 n=1 Tax=Xenopus laevis TaxID=8355 RepID=A0A8J1LB37_XENLA|nr:uncharacterized protein LOC108697305 isoform X2 [Xenopus laevis]
MMETDSEGKQGEHRGAEGNVADEEEAPSVGTLAIATEKEPTEPTDDLCDKRQQTNERPITGETGNSGSGSSVATSNNGDTGQGSQNKGPTTSDSMDCLTSEKGKTVTEQGETSTNCRETFIKHRENVVGQSETVSDQSETVVKQRETTTYFEETVTEQGETSKEQGESTTNQEDTVNEQNETATEQGETVTGQTETAGEHGEAASGQVETVTKQREIATEHREAATVREEKSTRQGETSTELGDTSTKQAEAATKHEETATVNEETAAQQGEAITEHESTATELEETSTEHEETSTEHEETATEQGQTTFGQEEHGEMVIQQRETDTKQGETENKQEETDDEQRETATKQTETVTEHRKTAVKYEQYEIENEQWETATEQWETEEGTTETYTQDIHLLTAEKIEQSRETLSEDSEEWETASDDSIDRPISDSPGEVQNQESVDSGRRDVREIQEILREREASGSKNLNTISYSIQTDCPTSSHEKMVTCNIGETETVDKITSVEERKAEETEDTLAINNEDNMLETIRECAAEAESDPKEGEQEIKGTEVKIGEQWGLLEVRKDTRAEIMAPSEATDSQESQTDKLETETPGKSREDGTVSDREGGLCNQVKKDTRVQRQCLMETDTGVQGQGLMETDIWVQGQGLMETDTGVQVKGLIEADTGVQVKGLVEQEITLQFWDVIKQSVDHNIAEKGHLAQEMTVVEVEEKDTEAQYVSSPPQAMETYDHGTQSNILAELNISCEIQDQMSGNINLGPFYEEPASSFSFQPLETQTSQNYYSDVFSPTDPNADQAEPEGYEQTKMPQFGDIAHQYNIQYQEEKSLCPAVFTSSAPYSTDPNNDGNHEISEVSQGADCIVVKETPSTLGILQEATGLVLLVNQPVALQNYKEISLERTEGSDSQKTGSYLSEQAMAKEETDSIMDMGKTETLGITRQWSTTESLGPSDCNLIQSDPYDESSLQKTRIMSLTPEVDKLEHYPEITRGAVTVSAFSPQIVQESDNMTASDLSDAESNQKSSFYPIQISNPIMNLTGSPEHLGFYSEGLVNPEGKTFMDLPGNQPGPNFEEPNSSPATKKPFGPLLNPVWVNPRQIRYSEGSDRVYRANEQRESFLVRRATIRQKKGTSRGMKRNSVFLPSTVDEQEPTKDKSGQSTVPTFSAINILRPESPQSGLRFRPESQAIIETEQLVDNSVQESFADEEEPIKKVRPSRRLDSVFLREKHDQKTPELSPRLRRKSKFYGASRVLYQEYSDEALNQAIKNQRPESPRLRRRESQDSYLQRLSMSSADSLWQDIPEIRGSVGFLSMSREEQKLQEAKFELIMSEALYLRSLNIAVDHFQYNPDLQEVLTAQDRQWLFSRLSEVRDASSEFLFDLEDEFQRNKYNFQVCNMVIDHEPNFRRVYLPYVTNQSYQERTFQRLLNNNPRFQQVLSKLESDPMCQRLGLKSFLILPFQRIIRLRLLLQNILKRSAPGSDDELQATQAHNNVEKLIRDCNESVQRMKDTEELILLNQKIQFECKIFPLISQSRRLIKHSEVSALELNSLSFKLKISRSVYLHLFNDCLLLSRTREGGRFLVFDYAHAADVRVERCEKRIHGNQKNIFCISLRDNAAGSPDGRRAEYFFCTDTQSQKLRWISALSPPKEEPDLFKYHGLSQMLCLKSYTARENDELSLEKADIIFVTQRSEDGWLRGVCLSDMQSGWFPLSHVQPVGRNACLRNLEEEQRLQTARAKLQLPLSN